MVFAPTVEIIRQKGGFVSAFVGDAITAVFPEVYAQQSVGAADDILSLISKMKSTKIGNYSFGIEARIGLAYGDIEWQIINSERRSVYYFKGETFYSAADSQQSADTGTCKFDKSIEKLQIPNKQPRDIRHKDIKSSVIRNFAPDQVITMKTSGEFRDIVSVFIMFREDQTDLKELSGFLCEKPMDHGGYLNKIDFGDKGGIALIIFGAPVAVEKYPERAVAFTLELIRAFPKVRAGISKGTAYCGFIGSKERCEYTAMGEVVNLSARIATKCGAGDILLDEKTAAYGFTAFSVTEKTSFKLKGFTKKIRVFSPEHKTETNLSSGNKFFVGRKNEFDRILKISDKAFRKGRSVVIQVNGDPGIGKSSLISAVRGYMEKTGVKWFYLQCDEILKKSLNPFSYFFKNYFGINDYNSEEESCALLRSGLTDFKNLPNYSAIEYFIGRLVGIKIENSVFDGLEIRESYENILYSVRTFFLKQAENSPVIIEIDDIHNIDESSKEALQAILRKTGDLPVVIVTSARFNSNGSIYKLESIDAETEYFSLTSLDKDSVRSLAENIYGTAISESLLDLLLHKGSGNPFYTEQMVLYLKESGKIEIPDRISSVIISRIDKLSSELKKLIRTASVLGKEFSVRLLAEVLKKKDISSQIGKAEQEAIWNKTTEIFYIFRHAILRDTVYEMQLKKTLKELHLLTAKTIENLYYQELSKHYADLAYHFEKAESFEDTKKYLNLAGYNSAENYRNAEAIGYYIKLYDYCRTEEEQAETYRNIGELYIRLGDWKNTESYFKKSYRKAIRYGSQLQIVKSGISLAEYYGEIGDFKKNIRLVKKMLAIAEKQKFSDQMNMIYLNLGVIYRLMSENDKSEKYYLKALKYYRLRKNHTMIRTIYDNLGVLYMSAGEFSKAKYYYRLAERRSVKENDSFGLMNIYNNMGMIYYYQGELEKALDLFGKSLELADKLGILRHKSIVYGQFAKIYFYKNEC
jgi:predicted ATPase/class 3 adenylate cyclase